ncbi:hypothetical protein L596_008604 [Steinernema carpocapsae]|uniref:C2H2-type domain-containing protein n=1 Tax=Steinernema carpocapsae TaxID=34508 RepID=A0A4V6A6C7_STECR|nr:hypothetical protein L596_008604 [Steinernema carpocapsae]
MQEAAFCCGECDFHSESREALDEHQKATHAAENAVEEAREKTEEPTTTHDDGQNLVEEKEDDGEVQAEEEQCPCAP